MEKINYGIDVMRISRREKIPKILKELIDNELGDICLGIYVYGSCFTDDYKNTSDIDFSAFFACEIDEKIYERVKTLVNHISTILPLAKKLEGECYYLDCNSVWSKHRSILVDQELGVCLDESKIDPDIVEMIRSRGYLVYGQPAQFVLPNITCEMVVDYYREYILETLNLLDFWKEQQKLIWHKILNVCRGFYYIINKNLLPKKEYAALWVMGRMPKYANVIQLALDIRAGKCDIRMKDDSAYLLKELLQYFLNSENSSCKEGYLRPMRTEVQMTTKCNCACLHCGYITTNTPDLTRLDYIYSFLEELKQTWGWIDRILFEGGEPTIEFQRLLMCVKKSKQLSVPNIQVNTNLVNVTMEQILKLIDAGVNYIEVSVDAIHEDIWYRMRGLSKCVAKDKLYNNFRNMLRFVCEQPELIVDFNYTPTMENISELEEVYRVACELGARYFSFQNLVCSTDKISNLSVSVNSLLKKLNSCIDIAKHYSFPPTILMCCAEAVDNSSDLLLYPSSFVEQFPCSYGKQYVYLNSELQLRSCCFGSGLTIGQYKPGNFSLLWSRKKFCKCPVVENKGKF